MDIWAIVVSGFSFSSGTFSPPFLEFYHWINTTVYVQFPEVQGCVFNLYYLLQDWILLQIVESLTFSCICFSVFSFSLEAGQMHHS